MQKCFLDENLLLENLSIRNLAEKMNKQGEILFENGEIDNARDIFLKAMEVDPDYYSLHNNLGVLFDHMGQKEKAIEHFQKALLLYPKDPQALLNYATISKTTCSCCNDSRHGWFHRRLMQVLDPLLSFKPDANWLTVGDGWGSEAHYIQSKGIERVISTDIFDKKLFISKKIGYINEHKKENSESLTFNDNTFDFVLCKEAIHHFSRPFTALNEMIRVTKNAVVLMEPLDRYGSHTFERNGDFVYTLSEREIEKFSVALKLSNVAFKPFNLHYPDLKGKPFDLEYSKSKYYEVNNEIVHNHDCLCDSEPYRYDSFVSIIFKKFTSDISFRTQLSDAGYRVVDLPITIHCTKCKAYSQIIKTGNWDCLCGNPLAREGKIINVI